MPIDKLFKQIWVGVTVVTCCASVVGCGDNKKCVDVSKPALDKCLGDEDKLRKEVVDLKRQLAQALANPGTIKVDPSVLMVNGEHVAPKLKEGSLSHAEVVATMTQNKKVLKACYERAMKKNPSLRRQTITLTVGFSVKPDGNPADIAVRPNYDSLMIDCMRKAIARWRFPRFTGQPVGVESPLTLTPKQN